MDGDELFSKISAIFFNETKHLCNISVMNTMTQRIYGKGVTSISSVSVRMNAEL